MFGQHKDAYFFCFAQNNIAQNIKISFQTSCLRHYFSFWRLLCYLLFRFYATFVVLKAKMYIERSFYYK